MNLFVPDKLNYIKGERPDVKCILCSVINKNKKVVSLEIKRFEYCCVSLNLYPYNPGHLMIFPLRHIEDIRELTENEELEINKVTKLMLDVLDDVYEPGGFNLGYNINKFSGASIAHIHLHIVPRYRSEIGFMDIIGGKKIIVETPDKTLDKLKNGIKDNINKYFKDKK